MFDVIYSEIENYARCEKLMEKIVYSSNYFMEDELLDELVEILNDKKVNIDITNTLYRARLDNGQLKIFSKLELIKMNMSQSYSNRFNSMSQEDVAIMNKEKEAYDILMNQFANGFFGYNSDNSYVPPKGLPISRGRANDEYVSYLYAADGIDTAISEVQPSLKMKVNISEIIILENLRLIDFTGLHCERNKSMANYFYFFIVTMFMKPITYNGELYRFTNFITEFVKYKFKDIDGIIFKSAKNVGGKNYVIFDSSKCKSINSRIITVNKITYNYEESDHAASKEALNDWLGP